MRLLYTDPLYETYDKEVNVNDEVHWSPEEKGGRTVILTLEPPSPKRPNGFIEVECCDGGEVTVEPRHINCRWAD